LNICLSLKKAQENKRSETQDFGWLFGLNFNPTNQPTWTMVNKERKAINARACSNNIYKDFRILSLFE